MNWQEFGLALTECLARGAELDCNCKGCPHEAVCDEAWRAGTSFAGMCDAIEVAGIELPSEQAE